MTQLDRIENRVEGMDERVRGIEITIGELRGERRAVKALWHMLTAVIGAIAGAIAGLFGGNLHIPGAH